MNAAGKGLVVNCQPRGLRLVGSGTVRGQAGKPVGREEMSQSERAVYERGRQEGELAAETRLAQQMMEQRNELSRYQAGVLESLRQALPKVIKEMEQGLIGLTLEVSKRLVSGLPVSAEMVEASVREALSEVKDSAECHVYVHPEDLKLLQDEGRLGAPGLQFHAAPEMERGGCVVKARCGVIDGRRETKMALAEAELLDVRTAGFREQAVDSSD